MPPAVTTNFKVEAVFLKVAALSKNMEQRLTSSCFLGHVSDAELRVGGFHLPPLLVGEPEEAGERTLRRVRVLRPLLLALAGRARAHLLVLGSQHCKRQIFLSQPACFNRQAMLFRWIGKEFTI
jgi:hypothetical protein